MAVDRRLIVWLVIAALVIGVGYLLVRPAGGGRSGGGDVDGARFAELAKQGVRIVDVRTPLEYQGGHVPGAENVPVDDIQQASASWDKTKPIAVYCLSGQRSTNAMQYLKAQGFSTVYNLAGGIDGWKGELTTGTDKGSALPKIPTNGKPRFIEFSSST